MIKVLVVLRDAAARNAWMNRISMFKDVVMINKFRYCDLLKQYEYQCEIYTDNLLRGCRPDLILYDSTLSRYTVDFFMCSKLPPQEITI